MNRRLIKGFSKVTRPLNNILRKDEDLHNFEDQKPEEYELFESLKKALISPPVLILPTLGRPFIVGVDASAYQVGFNLLQEHEDTSYLPVGYWFRSLRLAERNYSATKHE